MMKPIRIVITGSMVGGGKTVTTILFDLEVREVEERKHRRLIGQLFAMDLVALKESGMKSFSIELEGEPFLVGVF